MTTSDDVNIKKVKSFSSKCWVNYTGPKDHFNKTNIFYADNGHGKTSLANHIYDISCGSHLNNNTNTRIFNSNYIKSSMLVSESDNKINGVKVDFSKDNVNAEKQIKKLNIEISNLEDNLETIRSLCAEKEEKLKNIINESFNKHKGVSKAQTIRGDACDAFNQYIKKYDLLKKTYNDDKFSVFCPCDKNENKKVLLSCGNFAVTDTLLLSYDNVKTIMDKSYDSDVISKFDLLAWFQKGLDVSENDKCPFCGQHYDVELVKRKIESYKSDELKSAIKILQDQESILKKYIKEVKDANSSISNIKKCFNTDELEDDVSAINSSLIIIESAYSCIKDKLENMSKTFDCYTDCSDYIKKIYDAVCSINNIKTKEIQLLEGIEKDTNNFVKASVGFDLQNDKLAKELYDKLLQLKQKIDEAESDIIEKKKEVEDYKKSKQDISNFANYLNEILVAIGVLFWLETDNTGSSYYIKMNNDTILTIDDISEGERNLLSFLYFYYCLFDDSKQSKINTNIRSIIIDDPVCSLDNSFRIFIVSLLVNIASVGTQTFIFTHNWDVLSMVYRRLRDGSNVTYWRILKQNGVSEILPLNNKISQYRFLFSKVYAFSQMKLDDEGFEEKAIEAANNLRRILEEYILFVSGEISSHILNHDKVQNILFSDKNISKKDEVRFNNLMNVVNAFSHSIPDITDSANIHKAAVFYMHRMEQLHKAHFDKQKQ